VAVVSFKDRMAARKDRLVLVLDAERTVDLAFGMGA